MIDLPHCEPAEHGYYCSARGDAVGCPHPNHDHLEANRDPGDESASVEHTVADLLVELRAAEAVIDRQREQLGCLAAALGRLVAALEAIADADYRGNRSPESGHAHVALLAEGLRS